MKPTDLDDLAPVEPSDSLLSSVRVRGASVRRRRRTQRAASALSGVVVVVLVLGIVLTRGGNGNNSVSTPVSSTTSTTSLPNLALQTLVGAWLPTSVAGYHGPLTRPGLIDAPVLRFDDNGNWTGSDGCNDIGGSYRFERGGAFHLAQHVSTLVLCVRVVPMSTVFTAARATLVDGRLKLVARDGHEVASYERENISARIVLLQRVIVAGSTMSGEVVVENHTGDVIHATGCISLFQVALASADVQPSVAWDKCLQQFTIPVGESRYPVRVTATYQDCDHGPARVGNIPACLNGILPPLPAGEYTAKLFQGSPAIVPTPPPVDVTIVSQKATGGRS